MAITLKTVDFDLPREACGNILKALASVACDATPDLLTITIGLYTNDVVPDDTTEYTDLTIAVSTITPIELADGEGSCQDLEGPALNPDEWQWIIDQQIFTIAGGTPQTAFGAFLAVSTGGPTTLLGAKRFDVPWVGVEAADTLKLTAALVLLPQITPVV
jgi:hypothetical protein